MSLSDEIERFDGMVTACRERPVVDQIFLGDQWCGLLRVRAKQA